MGSHQLCPLPLLGDLSDPASCSRQALYYTGEGPEESHGVSAPEAHKGKPPRERAMRQETAVPVSSVGCTGCL